MLESSRVGEFENVAFEVPRGLQAMLESLRAGELDNRGPEGSTELHKTVQSAGKKREHLGACIALPILLHCRSNSSQSPASPPMAPHPPTHQVPARDPEDQLPQGLVGVSGEFGSKSKGSLRSLF